MITNKHFVVDFLKKYLKLELHYNVNVLINEITSTNLKFNMQDDKLKIDKDEFAAFLNDYIDFDYLNDLNPAKGAAIRGKKPKVEKIEIIDKNFVLKYKKPVLIKIKPKKPKKEETQKENLEKKAKVRKKVTMKSESKVLFSVEDFLEEIQKVFSDRFSIN